MADLQQNEAQNRQNTFVAYFLFGIVATVVNFAVYFTAKALIHGNDNYLIANILAWFAGVVVAFFVNKRYVFHSSGISKIHYQFMTFLAIRLLTLGGIQLALYYFAQRLTDLLPNASPSLIQDGVKVLLSVVEVLINYIFTKKVVFSDRIFQYYQRHLVTMTSVATALINYGVYYITKRLFFGIDYYMFADMAAWLVASIYFFVAIRSQMKRSKENALLVYYVVCLLSFLVSHLILRFTYGYFNAHLVGDWEWLTDALKPVLVVVFVFADYLVVQLGFPKAKLFDPPVQAKIPGGK